MGSKTLVWMGVLLGACAPRVPAASNTAEPAPAVRPEQLTAPPAVLVIGDLTLLQNGQPALVLRADGTVFAPTNQRVLGKLRPEGRFVDPNGRTLATLTKAGEVVVGEDDYLPVTVAEDGAVHLLKENRVVRLRNDGTLEGANPEGPAVSITGVTAETRRTAMFLLVLSAHPLRKPR